MNATIEGGRDESAPIALPTTQRGGASPAQPPTEISKLPVAFPPPPKPAIERVNMVLSRSSLDILDIASARILKNTGGRVNRSQLVRAMLEAFGESRLVFVGCRTEADVKAVCLGLYLGTGRIVAQARTESQRPR